MRMRFVADVHVGNHRQFGGEVRVGLNARAKSVLGGLIGVRDDSDGLVVLGDLFDTSNPSPQMLAATMSVLRGANAHLLLGNHDMVSTEVGDHALAPLAEVAAVYDVPRGVVLGEVGYLMLPFRPAPMDTWFASALDEAAGALGQKPQVVCFHGGVRDHNTPKYLWGSPDSIDAELLFDLMRVHGIELALCGNWHNHREWTKTEPARRIIQVGALVPTGFDNTGWDYGYFVDVELRARKLQVSVQKADVPLFLSVTSALVRKTSAALRERPNGVYLKLRLSEGETQEQLTPEIEQLVGPALRGLVFAAAETETVEQEKEAAEAARTASTLDEALREYLRSTPIPDGVDRQQVETRAFSYLGRGS